MKQKVYEKTGIKERKNSKTKQGLVEMQMLHKNEVIRSIEKGFYKKKCESLYSISLMHYDKEYQKIDKLLKDYKWCLESFSENTQILILGYIDYFKQYGTNMDSLGLRTFRKGILKAILISEKVQLEIQKNRKENKTLFVDQNIAQEDVIINYCIDNMEVLQEDGVNMENVAVLMNRLDDAGFPVENLKEYLLIKKRTEEIYREFV